MTMDSIDLDILKYCSTAENYDSVINLIGRDVCVKESWVLLQAFEKYYELGTENIGPDFKTWFKLKAHPELKKENQALYQRIIDNVLAHDMPEGPGFRAAIASLRKQGRLEEVLKAYKAGKMTEDELSHELNALSSATSSEDPEPEDIDVFDLVEHARHGGLFWRTEDLNKAVGPVSGGDFIVIAKRPEVGGTSFLCSEMTFMLEQLPSGAKAIIFNNEEEQFKLRGRVVSTALNKDYLGILDNPIASKDEYEEWLGEKQFQLIYNNQMTIQSIRRTIEKYKPAIVGVNVLLKVGGIQRKEDHDKLEQLGVQLRAMSADFNCPIFAVTQADPQADGVKYIPQTWIYKSKTALQGESDILIMIGTDDEGTEEDRYIHVAKNKIPPSVYTEPACKHIKAHVAFDVATGRFTSRNWKTHSRRDDYVYHGV